MSLLHFLPLALAPLFRSGAILNNRMITAFAVIGVASVLFASVSFGKLILALKRESNFASAFLSAPPRDAFADKVVWITGASSGIVSSS